MAHKWTTGDVLPLNEIYDEFSVRKEKVEAHKKKEKE